METEIDPKLLAVLASSSIDEIGAATLAACGRLATVDDSLPRELRASFTAFVETGDATALAELQLALVRIVRWNLGPEVFTRAVARLVNCGRMTQAEGARLLAELPYPLRVHLSKAAENVVDIATAVLEDVRDNVMDVDADDIFATAIVDLLDGSASSTHR